MLEQEEVIDLGDGGPPLPKGVYDAIVSHIQHQDAERAAFQRAKRKRRAKAKLARKQRHR